MKAVWRQLKDRRSEVASHPFFGWLSSDAAPLDERFVFAPVMVDFIMGFADMNKWFLSYAAPKTELERSINEHTEEDRTHSRLFYEEWYTAKLGAPASFGPGKTLWWLFHSSDSKNVRRFGMEILELAVKHQDALVRFAMIEAIEVCGDVFFENTAPLATRMSEYDGATHRYFGQYHRARETGHLQTDESAFLKAKLTAEQEASCKLVVDVVFDNFMLVLTEIHSFAERTTDEERGLTLALDDEFRCQLERGDTIVADPIVPDAAVLTEVCVTQRALVQHLESRLAGLREHALLSWLRDDESLPARRKLQGFVALWGIDIVGYKDFNELVLRYKQPQCALEREVNQQTDQLATHGALYLRDWQELELDSVLGWDAGETVAFYFLSEQTEVHRGNMAKLKKLAFGHPDAVSRSWLMHALESAGEPLFEATAEVAEQVEQDFGCRLDYWANRHARAHAHATAASSTRRSFMAAAVGAEQAATIRHIIDTVCDNMEEQFTLSHRAGRQQVFVHAPATLPPPRESGYVLKAQATHGAHDLVQLKRAG
ncbi:MAG: hypothetical protein JWN04_5396 [Myxococcaceae bacterium]|nr:hypothetical protein [Myxococcaceae bacterium]